MPADVVTVSPDLSFDDVTAPVAPEIKFDLSCVPVELKGTSLIYEPFTDKWLVERSGLAAETESVAISETAIIANAVIPNLFFMTYFLT